MKCFDKVERWRRPWQTQTSHSDRITIMTGKEASPDAQLIFEELQGSLLNKKLAQLQKKAPENSQKRLLEHRSATRVRSMSVMLNMLDCGSPGKPGIGEGSARRKGSLPALNRFEEHLQDLVSLKAGGIIPIYLSFCVEENNFQGSRGRHSSMPAIRHETEYATLPILESYCEQ